MRPRWKRAVTTVEGSLGESLGKLYVEQDFPAERKAHGSAGQEPVGRLQDKHQQAGLMVV
jgi:predicted metalloendopeptidase